MHVYMYTQKRVRRHANLGEFMILGLAYPNGEPQHGAGG
jgi:hypothetical protein